MTWEDVERRALFCPMLHRAVTMVRLGQASREEALITVAMLLSDEREAAINREVQHLRNAPPSPQVLIAPDGQRYTFTPR